MFPDERSKSSGGTKPERAGEEFFHLNLATASCTNMYQPQGLYMQSYAMPQHMGLPHKRSTIYMGKAVNF